MERNVRLAIESGVALRIVIGRHGVEALDRPGLFRQSLEWWRKQGVEGITFYDSMPGFYERSDANWRDIASVVQDAGLEVAAFNALRKSYFLRELVADELHRTEQCLNVCSILKPSVFDISVNAPYAHQAGAQAVAERRLFRGDHAPARDFEVSAVHLKNLARSCSVLGMQLSIELHDDGLQDTADNCLRLVKLVDEPNVGVNPDLGNYYRVSHELPEGWRPQIRKLAPLTNYWETKNYKRIWLAGERRAYSWSSELEEGDIDFRESASILWDAGFRGWVVNEGGTGDYIRTTLRYLEYMRWILDTWIPAERAIT
jgi:sugar phosphate isomerase/epimerase